MANRVASSGDASTYASRSKGLMVAGDIIIDEGQVNNGGVQPGIVYFDSFATKFATARNNAVIWFDGTALGTLFHIWFANGGVAIGKGHNIIRPLIGAPIRVVTTSGTNDGQTVVLVDFDSLEIDGEFLCKDGYPGMTHGVGNSKFLTGTFGFQVASGTVRTQNNIQVQIVVKDGGSIIARGFEISGGFAAFAVNQGVGAQLNDLILENFYLHDGHTGEGLYLNRTTGSPRPQFKGVYVCNGIIARRGTENVQIQNMVAAAKRGQIRNLVSVQSAITWKNAFMDDQDGHLQILADEGFNEVVNCIFDGGNVGMRIFSTTQGTPVSTVPFELRRILLQNTNERQIYLHSTANRDFRFVFNKIWVRNKGNKQTQLGKATTTEMIQDDGDPSKRSYIDVNWDSTIGAFAKTGSDTGSQKANCFQTTIPAPSFVNTGFLPDEQVSRWVDTYGSYTPNTGVKTTWALNEIMIDAGEGNNYRFYKTIVAHTSNGTQPASNPNVVLLTWDVNGVRSDWGGFISTYSYFPPDDLRLVANDPYNKRGLGLLSNELNTDYTQVQWFRAPNSNPLDSERLMIPGARTLKYTPRLVDKGYYIAIGIRPKSVNGKYGAWSFSTWKLVS